MRRQKKFRLLSPISLYGAMMLLCCALAGSVYALDGDNVKYIWPIEIDGYITGNFAECRWDHYHAGLDIGTHGVKGYKLYAIADGYVYRIRASAAGYGKAVYLRLADGRFVVYAHLDRFTDQLNNYIRTAQKEQGSYEISLNPPPEMFPVKQGDVIGYAGNSGDVAPHLHIELRNANEEPINILTNGLQLKNPDTTTPKISHIAVKPFDQTSLVDEQFGQMLYKTEQLDDTTYRITQPVRAWGAIGIKADTYDTERNGDFRLAIHTVSLAVDNKELYSLSLDRFSYGSEYHQNFFLYDRALKYSVSDSFQGDYVRLYTLPGIATPFSRADSTDGYLRCGDPSLSAMPGYLPPGDHQVRIDAADAAGNTSTLLFTLRVEQPAALRRTYAQRAVPAPAPVSIERYISMYDTFFSVTVTTSAPPDTLPETVVSVDSMVADPVQTLIHSDTRFEYVYLPVRNGTVEYDVSVRAQSDGVYTEAPRKRFAMTFVPQGGITIGRPGDAYSISIAPNNRPFLTTVRPLSGVPGHIALAQSSTVFELLPAAYELLDDATVTIRLANAPGAPHALFEWMGNTWRLLGTDSAPEEEFVAADIGHLSTIGVFSDADLPVIEFLAPDPHNNIIVSGAEIACRVYDTGVGLSLKKLRMTIDDQPVPAEFIPDENRYTYYIDDPLSAGLHTVTVTAVDRLSNTTRHSIEVEFIDR